MSNPTDPDDERLGLLIQELTVKWEWEHEYYLWLRDKCRQERLMAEKNSCEKYKTD
jgi:hypothetical protein